MSEVYRPVLAPLPLLLWKGIAHETVREAHPFAFRRGRFILADGAAAISALRPLITHEHVVIDISTFRQGEPVDPFQALIDWQAAPALWMVRRWRLRERVARQRQGPYLPGLRSRLRRFNPAVAGTVPASELADAPDEPTSATAPVLAMLSRLPLEDEA